MIAITEQNDLLLFHVSADLQEATMSRQRKRARGYGPPYEIHAEPEVDVDAEDVRDAADQRITSESIAATVRHVYATMNLGQPLLDGPSS